MEGGVLLSLDNAQDAQGTLVGLTNAFRLQGTTVGEDGTAGTCWTDGQGNEVRVIFNATSFDRLRQGLCSYLQCVLNSAVYE